jgi:hypothetical protein
MNTEADVPDILPEAARIVLDCQTALSGPLDSASQMRTIRHNSRRAAF